MQSPTDHWWEITESTDTKTLADSVGEAMRKYTFPFFDDCSTVDACYDWILKNGTEFRRAHVHLLQGDFKMAQACYDEIAKLANARYVLPRLERAAKKLDFSFRETL